MARKQRNMQVHSETLGPERTESFLDDDGPELNTDGAESLEPDSDTEPPPAPATKPRKREPRSDKGKPRGSRKAASKGPLDPKSEEYTVLLCLAAQRADEAEIDELGARLKVIRDGIEARFNDLTPRQQFMLRALESAEPERTTG